MDFNTLFDLLLKLVGLAAAAAVTYILPTVANKLKATIGVEKTGQLATTIRTFVVSAEQTLRLSGEEKKAYVEKQLEDLGIEVNELVKAMIEEAVYDTINFGEVKTKAIDNSPAEEE